MISPPTIGPAITPLFLSMIQNKNVFDYTATLDILDDISLADVKEMRDRVVSNMTIDCSAMGNVLDIEVS